MAFPSSSLDRFKIETEFGDGYVVQTTYEWELSAKVAKQSKWAEVERIGLGAFGSVWLEKQEPGGELRAVKRLQHDTLNRRSFTRELQALITLGEHKHLFVEFLGWYENKHNVFLAMEYIEYGDLRVYMRDFQIVEAEACEITGQILDGLKILHGEGICHRDLKPENILVVSRDPIWVKLADFGISKRTNNTSLKTRCGTPNYLAPELLGLLPPQFRVGSRFTFALDMWSLGCIVYELLTSQIPFLQPAEDGYDDITEGETSDEEIGAELDIGLLFQYCQGHVGFPSDVLQTSEVSDQGIAFVENLLAPNPTVRATAASALDTPWLARPAFSSPWYNDLVTNFSTLGIELRAPHGRESMKQLRSSDITLLLPSTADFRVLLEQALVNGFNTAAGMLLKTPSLLPIGDSIVRGLVKQEVTNGRLGFLKILLSIVGYDYSACGDLLHDAVTSGFTEIVQMLLDCKVNVDSRVNGRTALLAAVEHGNLNIVKVILKNGADVNMNPSGTYGPTALQAAAGGGHLDMVKILLIHGANINAAAPELFKGRTALQVAVEGGQHEIVALLLGKGAYVNPLGVQHGEHLNIGQLLLDNQANMDAPPSNLDCRTALYAAVENGDLNMVSLLLDHHARGQFALFTAVRNDHLDIVNLLLDDNNRRYFQEFINSAIFPPLPWAVQNRNVEMMKLLLDHGAILTPTVADKMINGGLDDLVGQYPQNRTRALEMEPRVVD